MGSVKRCNCAVTRGKGEARPDDRPTASLNRPAVVETPSDSSH